MVCRSIGRGVGMCMLLGALAVVVGGCASPTASLEPASDLTTEGTKGMALIEPESVSFAPLAEGNVVLIPAGRFYATGGSDPNHGFKGVDAYLPTFLSRFDPFDRCPRRSFASRSAPAELVELWLWHTGDWIALHVPNPGFPYIVSICMGDGGSKPALSRPVRVWLDPDPIETDRANGHDDVPGGTLLCEIDVTHTGRPRIEKKVYICDSPIIPAADHMIVVELQDGEFVPDPRVGQRDQNLLIDWLKLEPAE